ncbi:hypothetical protein NBO_13g0048 [Nosema bombycis CQ1]|uniref:Uncharacterized protein n=1 Tax=Nosema bombycis (strain CQ1 / CVCC 102059) TaxID=578461 RepID=R0KVJ1_NOSB1|nr:hypothetical protein NBO_13g0048 [Nosema bombycis CQ1]|eukprot:EOB14871.1 hypothetical protein NBO_13g0048 [Nosema bombycis CQ1]
MQSRRKITRRSQRNVTMLIDYNPDETTNVQDVNEREDVRIETSPARIEIANRQFDFVNIRALFESNSSIVRNNSNVSVVKQDQIARTVIEQNEIKPNDTRVFKTETTSKNQKNKDKIGEDAKKDYMNNPHHQKGASDKKDEQTFKDPLHQEGANDKKDEQIIKDHHHKEGANDKKDEQTIKDPYHQEEGANDKKDDQIIKGPLHQEGASDKKDEQTLKDHHHHKEGANDTDTNYDQYEDKQERMFPFNYLKNYWENMKKNK